MKRAFVITSLFIGLLYTASCQPVNSQKNDTKEDSTKPYLSLNMDSVWVKFRGVVGKYSVYYISFSNNDKVVIKSGNSTFKYPYITITIDSLDLVKTFVTYINKLYLDKTEKIILESKKIKTNSKSKTIMVNLHRSKVEQNTLAKAEVLSNNWGEPHSPTPRHLLFASGERGCEGGEAVIFLMFISNRLKYYSFLSLCFLCKYFLFLCKL
jgi:hypothetical protein